MVKNDVKSRQALLAIPKTPMHIPIIHKKLIAVWVVRPKSRANHNNVGFRRNIS